jgi:molybdopterin converting factor small subunit
MVRVVFTENIQRHVACPQAEAEGATVREVLEAVFAANARARAYVLDEQGALRRHMAIIVDGRILADRGKLSDPVEDGATIHVLQALSGG